MTECGHAVESSSLLSQDVLIVLILLRNSGTSLPWSWFCNCLTSLQHIVNLIVRTN